MKSKIIVLTYLIIVAAVLISNWIGVSFSWAALNYLILAIVFLYSVGLLISNIKLKSLKARITYLNLGIAMVVIVLLYLAAQPIILISGFLHVEKKQVEVWTIDPYKIELTFNLEWAGPGSYRYDLKRTIMTGLLEKELATTYLGARVDTCIIDFFGSQYSHLPVYKFDKCKQIVKKME